MKKIFILCGVLALAISLFMPVGSIVNHAIAPGIAQEIRDRGTPERILELQAQFKCGLVYFRIAIGTLGIWLLFLGATWKRLLAQIPAVSIRNIHPAFHHGVIAKKEIVFPLFWSIVSVVIAIPLLRKGFDTGEVGILMMLAKRGPLVSMACQNLSARAGQPGFAVIESIFVKFFGSSEHVARLPALVIGALAMFPQYLIARRYGAISLANLSCAGLAVTGFFLFYNTYARGYAMAMTAYLLCVLIILMLRSRQTWARWICLGVLSIIACYAHLASMLYIGFLLACFFVENSIIIYRQDARLSSVLKRCIQPAIVLGSAALALFTLYSVAIPTDIKYYKLFSVTDYYTAYHVNFRFFKVMIESWAWIRDAALCSWGQFGLFIAGLFIAFKRSRNMTLYLLAPAVLSLVLFRVKGLYLYTRYILDFLPFYVILCVLPIWKVLFDNPKVKRKVSVTVAVLLFGAIGLLSLGRLYAMERCGIRTAINDACSGTVRTPSIMGTLDGFINVRYYYPQAVSGYHDTDFWKEINSKEPPEFIITVPFANYLDLDIPGASRAIKEKYFLVRKYPSWLDIDDDQDSIYLYRLKKAR